MSLLVELASSSKSWKLFIALTPCVILLTGLFIITRLAWTKNLEIMLSALKSSEWLRFESAIWSMFGLWGKFLITGTIASLLHWPIKNLHIRLGKIKKEEIDNFPKSLKYQLLIGELLIAIGALLCAVTYHAYS
ncbi:hypothetical protein [Pseudomonas sichuanensis]|uniref:hypothetical protein n=1 Tax=Pseudomonas sichuanensis TaxID=2213015 RepID=UPI002ABA80EC|nr:hypothetical protein [Pseudomonas sichuanensis]MDZ4019367.1 hypothetical protein [Pseudomonas sichuanensis]